MFTRLGCKTVTLVTPNPVTVQDCIGEGLPTKTKTVAARCTDQIHNQSIDNSDGDVTQLQAFQLDQSKKSQGKEVKPWVMNCQI
jgi:hypothetical protein